MSLPPKKHIKSADSKIRIIAGDWRGRKLPVIDAPGLRPTGDRIKETLFNWLMPYIHNARCLDLFAGTGSLGLEALSRGASQVDFFEQNTQASMQLNKNLALLQCENATVTQGDALTMLQNTTKTKTYDIIFIDPPFAENLWLQSINALVTQQAIHTDGLIYIETPRHTVLETPTNWHILKQKNAGQICATLFQAT